MTPGIRSGTPLKSIFFAGILASSLAGTSGASADARVHVPQISAAAGGAYIRQIDDMAFARRPSPQRQATPTTASAGGEASVAREQIVRMLEFAREGQQEGFRLPRARLKIVSTTP